MFRIGEFSKIAHVTIRLLRYYDEIGLFVPATVDPESGYRYYTIEQLPRLNRILVMRDLGLSLEQIKEFLNANVSAEEIRGMLRFRQAQLQKQIRDDVVNLKAVEMRLQQVELGNHLRNFDVVMKEVPGQPILSYRANYETYEDFHADFNTFYEEGQKKKSLGHFLVILHTPEQQDAPGDVEMGWHISGSRKSITVADTEFVRHDLPDHEQMATIIRYGDVNVGLCLNAVGYWIAVNKAEITGPFREVYHRFDPTDVTRTIVEFQVPVDVT
jgi:DNA-binding transcriptional MerR regulator